MLERFFLCLQKYKERKSLDNLSHDENSGLQRALFAAGHIAGATDFDNYKDMPNEAKILEIGSITSSLYEVYAKFVRIPGNASCAAKAVQVQLQCLKSVKELLHFEEQRLEKGLAMQTTNRSKSKEQQVQGDQEADASLIGNIMQVELGNILLLSLQNPPQVRMEAVACIGALLTQGLVNPLQCIPYLVALEADRVVANRDAAHAQLLALHEKYSRQFQMPCIQAHLISALPYDVEDEPLYIIYLINRHVSLHLSPVLDALKKIFAEAGLAPELMNDEDYNLAKVTIDEYYPLASLTGAQLAGLQDFGHSAFALALALRLKFALKTMYGLDNGKCATYQPSGQGNDTDYSVEVAHLSDKRKLLLPSVDDVCQSKDPVQVSWNLFMLAWRAARKDQKQLDFEEFATAKAPPKRRRRSRKVVARQHVAENDGDEEDEYVEGFA
ncbi:hypothetical protein BBI17_003282 [Phytophthora kernoviae]|uniref:Sister chromatid cohesion protein n=2 Tax=Phytophthora kernoviae TaxID=325452 RepID=A0A421EVR8_9STRA|nr:hypothetical protein G195_002608 [Phytophthora kernoviae 00238/432]KAG2532388.1 hypothetical protein JM16_000341 [Phytophthora kernoviae]KAG2533451.1 hypothetical protein JM18_000257 [Phytophthora kernoviae]RLN05730.1 hypothetical protein BBI17_003282 [Phytophthora kernoviae]